MLEFFNHPVFVIIGGIMTFFSIILFLYAIYIVLNGVLPVWIRLGKSLHGKKIAVYAEQDFESLKSLLVDSGIFKKKNITKISKDSIEKGETFTMMLVNYPEFPEKLEAIMQSKKDSDSLIIYAPHSFGRLDNDIMKNINSKRNSIVVNFRGRLLNDIVTSMITTVYEKK